jgi:hypothetical protein
LFTRIYLDGRYRLLIFWQYSGFISLFKSLRRTDRFWFIFFGFTLLEYSSSWAHEHLNFRIPPTNYSILASSLKVHISITLSTRDMGIRSMLIWESSNEMVWCLARFCRLSNAFRSYLFTSLEKFCVSKYSNIPREKT